MQSKRNTHNVHLLAQRPHVHGLVTRMVSLKAGSKTPERQRCVVLLSKWGTMLSIVMRLLGFDYELTFQGLSQGHIVESVCFVVCMFLYLYVFLYFMDLEDQFASTDLI